MSALSLVLPQGWPWSLWFLIAAALVVLLQRIPFTGIFLMFALAMFWSVFLINAGMIGIAWEVFTGKVGKAWLILPALYFGGYYLAYGWERLELGRVKAELAAQNVGKQLRFDPDRQDLVFEKGKGEMHPGLAPLLETHALGRFFEKGKVHFIGTPDACKVARGALAQSSGIHALGLSRPRKPKAQQTPNPGANLCAIMAPGIPERPVVRIINDQSKERRGPLPVTVMTFTLRDEAGGQEVSVRSIRAASLAPFPMPIIGYALNSGAPAWEGFAGFARRRPQTLPAFGPQDPPPSEVDILARALALEPLSDPQARAVGAETVEAMTRAADKELTDKEMALLEKMLADPLVHHDKSWLFHLPRRPAVVAPLADRIFAALGQLQTSDRRGSETGRNLWRLVAVLPDEVLAPHRAKLVEWLTPTNARPWTSKTGEVYAKLDAAVPVERAILLDRLKANRSELETGLLPGFCRMGSAAPDDAKRALLEIWRARAPDPAKPKAERGQSDAVLYFTLARLGLKDQAGQVVQRYYGPTFAGIWSEIEADSHAQLCDVSLNDLSNHFRKR